MQMLHNEVSTKMWFWIYTILSVFEDNDNILECHTPFTIKDFLEIAIPLIIFVVFLVIGFLWAFRKI